MNGREWRGTKRFVPFGVTSQVKGENSLGDEQNVNT